MANAFSKNKWQKHLANANGGNIWQTQMAETSGITPVSIPPLKQKTVIIRTVI